MYVVVVVQVANNLNQASFSTRLLIKFKFVYTTTTERGGDQIIIIIRLTTKVFPICITNLFCIYYYSVSV